MCSFLTVLEAGASVRAFFLTHRWQMSILSLCPHVWEGVRELCGVSYKDTDPIHEGATLVT